MLADLQRTIIIGNSGAGKSTLAERLAALIPAPAVDLDLLHWEDDGRGPRRDESAARALVGDIAAGPIWVIEGVYGWLAEVAVPRATALLWLDLPWSVCHERLMARGQRRRGTETEFAELLEWAAAYWDRPTSSSYAGHARLHHAFARVKHRLRMRDEVAAFLAQLRGD